MAERRSYCTTAGDRGWVPREPAGEGWCPWDTTGASGPGPSPGVMFQKHRRGWSDSQTAGEAGGPDVGTGPSDGLPGRGWFDSRTAGDRGLVSPGKPPGISETPASAG